MIKINNPFTFKQGETPILVSMPHSGIELLPEMSQRLTKQARNLPDTDWHIPELYDFLADLNVSTISANYSRYVVDLNRPVNDKPLYTTKTTGLFPTILFTDKPVFLSGQAHTDKLKEQIKEEIWHPYHQKIQDELIRIKNIFGYAILFDAHSIASELPMLFSGTLPDFNFGNDNGKACAQPLLAMLDSIIDKSNYQQVSNGRFKGGYITRSFGQPSQQIHAIQLELSQSTYLANEPSTYQIDRDKKQQIQPLLKQLLNALLASGNPKNL